MHGHVHLADGRYAQQPVRDALREMLDQVGVLAFDDGDDLLGCTTVVDGVVQVVACPGRLKVEIQRGVHDERLRTLMLEVKHAVRSVGAYTGKNDAIHRCPSPFARRMPYRLRRIHMKPCSR